MDKSFHPTFYNGFMLRLKLIYVDRNGTHVVSRFRFTQFILRFAGNILRLFTMVIYISVVDIWALLENLETIWPHNRISLASHPMPGVHALQMLIYRECHAFWILWIIVYFKIWIIISSVEFGTLPWSSLKMIGSVLTSILVLTGSQWSVMSAGVIFPQAENYSVLEYFLWNYSHANVRYYLWRHGFR